MVNKTEFQFGWTHKTGDDYLSVKGESPEEAVESMTKLENAIRDRFVPVKGETKENPKDTASQSEEHGGSTTEVKDYCNTHKVEMKKNKNGKYYHREFVAGQGSRFCNGFGYGDWIK